MHNCCVPHCTSYDMEPNNITFHCFPRDPFLRDKWRIAVSRLDKNSGTLWSPKPYSRVCSLHFLESDFSVSTATRRRLLPNTVPSVFKNNPALNHKYKIQRKIPFPTTDVPPLKMKKLVHAKTENEVQDDNFCVEENDIKIKVESPSSLPSAKEDSQVMVEQIKTELEEYEGKLNQTKVKEEVKLPDNETQLSDSKENIGELLEHCENVEILNASAQDSRNYVSVPNEDVTGPDKAQEKPYMCSVCKELFAEEIELDDHMTGHKAQKPFVCSGCGEAFFYNSQLLAHMGTHETIRCKFCNCSRLRMHKKETSYVCNTCEIYIRP